MDLKSFAAELNKKKSFSGIIKFSEPMRKHTSFKTGGPADIYIRPSKKIFLSWVPALLRVAEERAIPVFILGGGSNLLVSDKGIRGIVLDTRCWSGIEVEKSSSETASVQIMAGSQTSRAVKRAASLGCSGMEFLSGLPGTIGGAVWMNARCYEKSISDLLIETEILDEEFNIKTIPFCAEDFSYKKSPFQSRKCLILSARFKIAAGRSVEIKKSMKKYLNDRKAKGHFRYPSAGSAFKNNRDFGAPTGKIIDELGLKGMSVGGACVAPWHGNLIINKGQASSMEIRSLMEKIIEVAKKERGIELEPEIIFTGEW